ncbi:response regulator [Nakamurella deserti]|uniref:response regulator n=1 Tax=Nakamurella deserti TaxID=2164074 RepID=UPI000DBE00F4|nr:response regulator transcription factor [Nakamurella deserti]
MTTRPTPTRVLLVDDHPLVRAGLAALISGAPDLEVVAEAPGGESAADVAAEHRPDVVLMDLSMPGVDGVEATRRVLAVRPATRVVVLTSFSDTARVTEALRAGAIGYLLKDSDPAQLLSAIRSAARGHAPLDPRIATALLPTAAVPLSEQLSARERQVLVLLTRGLSNRQIGRDLGIAERTVKVHVGSLFRRLGVADRTSAAMWARDHLPDARR